VTASPTQVAVGGSATFSINVLDKNSAPATKLHVTVTLPPRATIASTYVDRGSGCTGETPTLDCDLNYLAAAPAQQGNIRIVLTFPIAGPQTLTAYAHSDIADLDSSNNTGEATVQVGSAPPPPTTTTTSSPPPPPTSRKPTGVRTIHGTAKADHITGTRGRDVIYGGKGNDVIWSGLGNDTVWGGFGNDVINGGGGNDVLWGGYGNDRITGGPGLDKIYAGPGADVVFARDGQVDHIDCGAGHDIVWADRKDVVTKKTCEVVHRR
jgi:hypothetical protein